VVIFIYLALIFPTQNSLKIDFGKEKDGHTWQIINDNVMGGMSNSKISFTENSMLFEGVISLQNNGGFASVRSPIRNMDLSKYTKVKMRYKSSIRNFDLIFSNDLKYYNPKYKLGFSPKTENWETKEFLLKDAIETRMGQPTGASISDQNLKNIIRFGFILSDKREGSFVLEIDYLEFY